jgi:protection of telomeres protein 1
MCSLKVNKRLLNQVTERLFILWGNLCEIKTLLRDAGSDLPLPPGDNRIQNKPFDCCIEEYGHSVHLTEKNPEGWQRMHMLVQTHISSSH